MTTITAVECVQCKMLHPVTGKYLFVTVDVKEHVDDNASDWLKKQAKSLRYDDVVLCNDLCLANLLSTED